MFLGFGPRNVSLDMFLDWLRNISSYVPRPRFPCSLMFIKIYSSVMFLGWLGNISYVPRPLSHPGSEKIKPKPLYVCPGCSNHTYSNNMVNRYNISINYRVKSYKMTGGSKRKITE
jgi:hypothetical protein